MPRSRLIPLYLLSSGLLGCLSPHRAFDLREASPVAAKPASAAGQRFVPDSSKFDWIRLKSDEWLKGRVVRLWNRELGFSSSQLSSLSLPWSSVVELHSSKTQTILLDGRQTHTGRIRVEEGKLRFLGETVREVPRARLLAIVPGAPELANRWSAKADLGVSQRGGNTEQTDTSLYVFARRETADTRWDSKYNMNLSEVSSDETANSHRVVTSFDMSLTRRMRLTALAGEFYRDRFQNIDYRISPWIGLGYDVVRRPTFKWEVIGGPAYRVTRFDSVIAGQELRDETAAVQLGTKFEWQPMSRVELGVDYQLIAPVPQTHYYSHHLLTRLSFKLIDHVSAQLSFTWDRSNRRIATASGDTPDADDFYTSVGFGVSF